jgi:hypothetical protein
MAGKGVKIPKEDYEYIRVLAREILEGEARKFAREELRGYMKEEAWRLVQSTNFQNILISEVKSNLKAVVQDIIYRAVGDSIPAWDTLDLNSRGIAMQIASKVDKTVVQAVNAALTVVELDKRVEATVTKRLNSFKIKATFE